MSPVPPEIVACMKGAEPTEEQWAAIAMPLEPYVLIAAAGSGKTAVMAARVIHLALEHGIAPGNVLCITFTNKATENLSERVRLAIAMMGDRRDDAGEWLVADGDEPLVTNYHRFGQEILARHGMLVGAEPGQRILTQAQRVELCGRVLDRMDFPEAGLRTHGTIVNDILDLADQAADHLVEPEAIVAHCEERLAGLTGRRPAALVSAYRQRAELALGVRQFLDLKRELGVIDFGDQIALALRVVREHPDVAAEYRDRFRAVLLDEYQDTNVAQARLLHAIFGGGHPVTAVGDPDQNIYAWRGASLNNLLEFPRVFRRDDGTEARRLPLSTNFRSGSAILAAADTVVAPLPEAERPDAAQRLVARPGAGRGTVELRGFDDEIAESEAIADAILAEHATGTPWREIAVICRRYRQYVPLRRAFDRRGIPGEFSGLAGLLQLPEIVEVLSYARAAADVGASPPLTRILLGPRFRVGIHDLAAVAAWAKGRTAALRGEFGEVGEELPVLVAEALDHLDDVEGLSAEGRERLATFRAELHELRALARGPVPAFLSEVIRRIGLGPELDANLAPEAAAAARRNLASFLDQVGAFTPLEGDLTLERFLAHLDRLAAGDRDEWTRPPGDGDAVQVMTIHAAKGLEFDAVFVPGLSKEVFPSQRIQHNPAKHGRSLDFELRGDAAILPTFEGVLERFEGHLRTHELSSERRTCYVALTRARNRLWVSAPNWLDGYVEPKNVGRFLEELWEWGEAEDDVAVERVEPVGDGVENPLAGERVRNLPSWPGAARPDDVDALFPEGWRRAAVAAASGGDDLLARLPEADRERAGRAAAERRTLATHLVEREREADPGPWLPPQISVNGVVQHARCPKSFYWTAVRPLPRASGPAARIGTDVHRWIERQSLGQATLLEEDARPDLVDEELAGEPGRVERLQRAYLESRFAGVVPLFVERSFLLAFGRFTVGGRIDAIYGSEDGPWEIVDWKTGRKPADDAVARMQLDLYALACMEVWRKRREGLRLTYLYLASGEEATHEPEDAATIRARVAERLASVEERRFDATPGPQCRWCDFRPFCPEGRAHLEG
ncbi:MAG: ATP-dependent helicase [Actinomycetota bacterium]